MGDRDVTAAVDGGQIALKGAAALTRAFPSWLLLSPFAKVPRADEPERPSSSYGRTRRATRYAAPVRA